MICLAQAIYSLYTNATNIINSTDINTVEVYDANNNRIDVDKTAIIAKNDELNVQSVLNNCKNKAKSLLALSDWSVLGDVGLTNSADFIAYRAVLRGLVLNPVANPTFPTEPQAVWS